MPWVIVQAIVLLEKKQIHPTIKMTKKVAEVA